MSSPVPSDAPKEALPNADDIMFLITPDIDARGAESTRPSDRSLGGFWEGGRHWSAVTADDAIDFLGEAKAGEQPAFFYVAFNAPHDPRQSPQEFRAILTEFIKI